MLVQLCYVSGVVSLKRVARVSSWCVGGKVKYSLIYFDEWDQVLWCSIAGRNCLDFIAIFSRAILFNPVWARLFFTYALSRCPCDEPEAPAARPDFSSTWSKKDVGRSSRRRGSFRTVGWWPNEHHIWHMVQSGRCGNLTRRLSRRRAMKPWITLNVTFQNQTYCSCMKAPNEVPS